MKSETLPASNSAVADNAPNAIDAAFVFADRFLVYDHVDRKVYIAAISTEKSAQSNSAWIENTKDIIAELQQNSALDFTSLNLDEVEKILSVCEPRESYNAKIALCLEEITNGESYELCLTTQLRPKFRLKKNALLTYRALRRVNPAPYGAYLVFQDLVIASSSPEMFLRIDRDGLVESKPIKGTCRRSKDPAQDDCLKKDLLSSEKERAENLMVLVMSFSRQSTDCVDRGSHSE